MFQTNYENGQRQNPITDTVFDTVSISGAPIGIWANEHGPAAGDATFTNTRFSDNGTDVRNTTSTFRLAGL
jgi:hypothetical protein